MNNALIPPVHEDDTSPEAARLLSEIETHLGRAPNYLRTVAHSPVALRVLWQQLGAAQEMHLSPRLRQAIALRVAELNTCSYSLAAEAASCPTNGVEETEVMGYRRGLSYDRKEQALLALVTKLVRDKGCNAGMVLDACRSVGVTDQEIIEAIALIATHVFVNYLSNIANTEIDYPAVDSLPPVTRKGTQKGTAE